MDYYKEFYAKQQSLGIQGWGNSLTSDSLLRAIGKVDHEIVLELGAGSGEFTARFLAKYAPVKYWASDLHPGAANPKLMNYLLDSSACSNQTECLRGRSDEELEEESKKERGGVGCAF